MASRIADETRRYAAILAADVLEHAETEGQESFLAEAFTDLVLDELEEEGFWPDFQLSYLSQRGVELSAWGLDETTRTLFVSITDFEYSDEVRTISRTEIAALYRRLTTFLNRAKAGTIEVQDHNPVRDVVGTIEAGDEFDTIRCCLLTNRITSSVDIPDGSLGDTPIHFRSWDLESVRRLRQTGTQLDPIDVDFLTRYGEGVPCLRSPQVQSEVETLLAFIPGSYLADIYLEFGPRLLERNVRSFLMARGKINQGIRDTLRFEPERFLAYNNGLTATAASIETKENSDGVLTVTRISELQIVNGGQTTASIAVAARDPLIDLKNVSVQVKLAVVAPGLLDELVPNISRFANRQNAVQDSDLAANHDYLRQLQMVSRAEWTPSGGLGRASKWYFERARGSYAVEKSEAGTPSQQAQFLAAYPADQKFGKNELAVYENTWACLPHLVCRGGQKNFAEFVDRLPQMQSTQHPDEDPDYRQVFRDLVAKAILFKAADKLVYRELGGTYKRAVVAYTLAYFLANTTRLPDLSLIWRTQRIDPSIERILRQIAPPLKELLITSAEGRNITEWAKHRACWELMESAPFEFDAEPLSPSEPVPPPSTADEDPVAGRPVSPDGERGAPLAIAIETVFGEKINGPWRRYRRPKWKHVGDSGVEAPSARDTLHIFQGEFKKSNGTPYVLSVAVDFPARSITPIITLPPDTQRAVVKWLSAQQPPQD